MQDNAVTIYPFCEAHHSKGSRSILLIMYEDLGFQLSAVSCVEMTASGFDNIVVGAFHVLIRIFESP